MNINIKKNLALTALLIYWGLILVLTSLPQDNMPNVQTNDKLSHFFAYLGLSFLFYSYLRLKRGIDSHKKQIITLVLSVVIIYGALDEIHQMFVPGRSADIIDWIADSLGAVSGVLIITGIEKYMPFLFWGKQGREAGKM